MGRRCMVTAGYLGSLSDGVLGLGLILFFTGNLRMDNLIPFFTDSGTWGWSELSNRLLSLPLQSSYSSFSTCNYRKCYIFVVVCLFVFRKFVRKPHSCSQAPWYTQEGAAMLGAISFEHAFCAVYGVGLCGRAVALSIRSVCLLGL